ncbi:hypothetical protein IW140_000156 [Coemansia sp. RSA 1813]|nr:hypothetical protein EV178_000037 [Coemansia sp. RSA 1646]KAJ1772322.1 hypothetical protein LPJ74_001587 [Coemansia sp. RSA 1843]KAJ2093261.1 hypothetical protein IW138_000554 [Coemansia sp. RSA 986]KAJ2213048.1 hypothetical protein EV179_004196 [Coemansia sp. RSA 487]KAJ2573514.1 hypothetical protein IW140_000156 [Coemansia sp. RSA 1813]
MSNVYNQAAGAVKETLGKITGNESREQEGHNQRAQGLGEQQLNKDEQQRANIRDDPSLNKASGGMREAGGAAKEKFGQAMGNEDMQSAGRQARAQGKGEQNIQDQRMNQ